MRYFLFTLILLFLSPASFAWNVHAKTGFEYDSNVFKNFENSKGDFLFRAMLHANGSVARWNGASLSFSYNLGGKKYFQNDAQDMVLQSAQLPLYIRLNAKTNLLLTTIGKYQNENDKLDLAGRDVNEDYWSIGQSARLQHQYNEDHRLLFSASFSYFDFIPRSSFSFFSEILSWEFQKQIINDLWLTTGYALSLQQFRSNDRKDREQQFSVGLKAFIIPYISLRYQYEINESNNNLFDTTNHRISFLISYLVGKTETRKKAPISFHLISTLQIINFPSVNGFTVEGERVLLSGAEDQNFNTLTAKVAYHPTEKWALETKYSRFSNELSSQEINFSRNLYYVGFRYEL